MRMYRCHLFSLFRMIWISLLFRIKKGVIRLPFIPTCSCLVVLFLLPYFFSAGHYVLCRWIFPIFALWWILFLREFLDLLSSSRGLEPIYIFHARSSRKMDTQTALYYQHGEETCATQYGPTWTRTRLVPSRGWGSARGLADVAILTSAVGDRFSPQKNRVSIQL